MVVFKRTGSVIYGDPHAGVPAVRASDRAIRHLCKIPTPMRHHQLERPPSQLVDRSIRTLQSCSGSASVHRLRTSSGADHADTCTCRHKSNYRMYRLMSCGGLGARDCWWSFVVGGDIGDASCLGASAPRECIGGRDLFSRYGLYV